MKLLVCSIRANPTLVPNLMPKPKFGIKIGKTQTLCQILAMLFLVPNLASTLAIAKLAHYPRHLIGTGKCV